MANVVDYLPFATGPGATVDTQANYLGSNYQTTGMAAGIAEPTQFNKVWRQSSVVAAALANLVSQTLNVSVLDDGNVAGLTNQLSIAIQSIGSIGTGSFLSLSNTALQTMAGPLSATAINTPGTLGVGGSLTCGSLSTANITATGNLSVSRAISGLSLTAATITCTSTTTTGNLVANNLSVSQGAGFSNVSATSITTANMTVAGSGKPSVSRREQRLISAVHERFGYWTILPCANLASDGRSY